jgi:hypothetical protein
MCIWAKYIVIVEHKANSAWDTIRHDVKSLLGIHLELGENVKISNIQKIVNKTTLIFKKLCNNSKVDVLILGTNLSILLISRNRN